MRVYGWRKRRKEKYDRRGQRSQSLEVLEIWNSWDSLTGLKLPNQVETTSVSWNFCRFCGNKSFNEIGTNTSHLQAN